MGPRCQRNISFGRQPPSSCSSFSSAPRSPPPFNDFPRLGDRARWDSGHASHAHVCTCVYIVYILVYIYVYIHTNTRVYTATHPPGRSLILLRIFGWIEAKGEEMIPLSPSLSHLGHVPFTNKAGFSFFFPLRPISRVITNGDTRISLFGRRTACLRKFRDEALAICFYLSRENGVPGKEYCLLSNTKLFRNVICETDPEAISGKQYYRKKNFTSNGWRYMLNAFHKLTRIEYVKIIPCPSRSWTHISSFIIYAKRTKSCSIHTRYVYFYVYVTTRLLFF